MEFFFLLGLLTVIAFIAGGVVATSGSSATGLGLIGVGLSWFILSTVVFLGFSVRNIENGHVGLVKTGGAIVSQRGNGSGGYTFIWPWQTMQSANVQIQSMCPDGTPAKNDSCSTTYATFSSESIDVDINARLNFHVDPEHIQTLYRTVGPDYVSKIIQPRVSQIIKEEVVKYQAVDVAPHREDIRKAVTARLVTELGERSIVADDFLLTNVDFPNKDVKAAIDQKVIEAQKAAAAEQAVQTAKQQAAAAAATAQGTADKTRIEAQGQADANRTISESLTPELIQFQMIQKFADNVQFYGFPTGSTPLFNLPSTTK